MSLRVLVITAMATLVGCASTGPSEPTAPAARPAESSAPADASTTSVSATAENRPDTTPTSLANDVPNDVQVALPDAMVVLDVTSVDRPVVHGFVDDGTGGGLQDEVLWAPHQPFETATTIGSLFPEDDFPPEVTQLLELNGVYYAFTAGHALSDPLAPTVITSTDGVEWSAGPIEPLLQPAAISIFTPDSPPYPGKSAIVDAVVDDQRILATGWATVAGEVVPALWTFGGGVWRFELIAVDSAFENLYGTQIATTDRGPIVRIGGPIHTGIATVTRGVGGWEPVDPVDDQGSPEMVAGNQLYLYRLVIPVTDSKPVLLWSEDRSSWVPTPLPAVEEADPFRWTLEASTWHDPIMWQETFGDEALGAVIWTLDRGRWEETRLRGHRVVTADEQLLATGSSTALYLYDRRGP